MKPLRVGLGLVLLGTACVHRVEDYRPDPLPFDQRLAQLAAAHNRVDAETIRTFLAKSATIQSPVTPRAAGADEFLRALAANPYTIRFTQTETLYSLPNRVATRSTVEAVAPGRFRFLEPVTIDWLLEDGDWRIARLRFPAWSPMVGTWRRSGRRAEGALELRILPEGKYVVYVAEDYSAPAFRGTYTTEGNRITFTDTSAEDPGQFQRGAGTYLFVRTANGAEFRRVSEDNPWRDERFDGAWIAR